VPVYVPGVPCSHNEVTALAYLTVPYLTFGGISCSALRLYQFRPVCIADVTKGYENLLEVLVNVNCRRVAGFALHSF